MKTVHVPQKRVGLLLDLTSAWWSESGTPTADVSDDLRETLWPNRRKVIPKSMAVRVLVKA